MPCWYSLGETSSKTWNWTSRNPPANRTWWLKWHQSLNFWGMIAVWESSDRSKAAQLAITYKATIPAGLIILKRHAKRKAKTAKTERFTSCSGSAGDNGTWALGPDRTGRPGAECGWSGPTTGTGADGPGGSPRHTWTNTHRSEDRKRRCVGLCGGAGDVCCGGKSLCRWWSTLFLGISFV